MRNLKGVSRAGGVAAILVALGLASFFGLEMYRSNLGFPDADHPVMSMAFLRQHSDIYILSGIGSVVTGVAVAVAALAVWRLASQRSSPLTMQVGTLFGLLSAAYFFGQGVLRIQAPGTLLYMESLNRDWGSAAYLAVQMAGTQGLGSAGGFALSIWIVGVALGGRSSGIFPPLLSWLAAVPALLLLGLVGPLTELGESLFVIILPVMLGVMLWCLGLGVALLRWKPIPSAPAPTSADEGLGPNTGAR